MTTLRKPDTSAFHDPLAIQLSNEGAEVAQMVTALEQAPINSPDDLAKLGELVKEAKRRGKQLEADEKAWTEESSEFVKRVRAYYKPARDAYKRLEDAIKSRLLRHEREVQQAREQLQQAAGAAFQAGNAQAAHAALAQVPQATQVAGVSFRKSITYQVTDPDLVPRAFCSPDGAKIGAAVKAAGLACAIPGVRVFEDSTAAVYT